MLSVVCWRWGDYAAEYVNRLRRMMARHLHAPHRFVCVTDDAAGIDSLVEIVEPPPMASIMEPRCRRRLWQYDEVFARSLGERILSIDLDVVIVDDVTPLFCRPERLALWRVSGHGAWCGSPVLMVPGVLRGMWERFTEDPAGALVAASSRKGHVASDQDVLNHYLNWLGAPVPGWTDADGLVTNPVPWQRLGPDRETHPLSALPRGARIVFMGGAERKVMDERWYPWIDEHWR
jgi:hypothetical protein